MTDLEFDVVRKLVLERSAIVLEPGKQYLVESRLAPIIRELQLSSLTELIAKLQVRPANGLQQRVVEAMVTTETSFFRDHHPFDALRKDVLPDLISRRRAERRLQVWCAATSTGQEPFSVAMLIRDAFPDLSAWDIRILATDLSTENLARAREGCYSQIEVNRGLPASLLLKHFDQRGARWHLKPALRQMVEFRELNLAKPWPALPRMDLVLMRNVMIYFDIEMKRAILRQLAPVLRPDGYLLLGGSETTFNIDGSYKRVESLKAVFYRIS
jgi:chemotaxis protein methyltransferase CheR